MHTAAKTLGVERTRAAMNALRYLGSGATLAQVESFMGAELAEPPPDRSERGIVRRIGARGTKGRDAAGQAAEAPANLWNQPEPEPLQLHHHVATNAQLVALFAGHAFNNAKRRAVAALADAIPLRHDPAATLRAAVTNSVTDPNVQATLHSAINKEFRVPTSGSQVDLELVFYMFAHELLEELTLYRDVFSSFFQWSLFAPVPDVRLLEYVRTAFHVEMGALLFDSPPVPADKVRGTLKAPQLPANFPPLLVRDDLPVQEEELLDGLFAVFGASFLYWTMDKTWTFAEMDDMANDAASLMAGLLHQSGPGQSHLHTVLRMEMRFRNVAIAPAMRLLMPSGRLRMLYSAFERYRDDRTGPTTSKTDDKRWPAWIDYVRNRAGNPAPERGSKDFFVDDDKDKNGRRYPFPPGLS